MKPALITASTIQELSPLIRTIKARKLPSVEFPETYEGEVGPAGVLLAVTGMGKVNAAASITSLLERHKPGLLINTGCAGAYAGGGLAVGDLALATTEIFGDEGVLTPTGWESLEFIGIPALERKGNRYFNEFPLSFSATEKAMQLAIALGLPIRRGRFVTVSTCSGTKARGEELFSQFGGICENMEGAAAAQVALIYGVDCLEVRGISNLVEDRDLSNWDIPLAVERVQRFVLRFIETM
ncbi:MAG: purine phosphorylase family [Geobacteraceae bacterium]|nr:MAG: purine phosphorylase family [Geobacteraceae bacterium]